MLTFDLFSLHDLTTHFGQPREANRRARDQQ